MKKIFLTLIGAFGLFCSISTSAIAAENSETKGENAGLYGGPTAGLFLGHPMANKALEDSLKSSNLKSSGMKIFFTGGAFVGYGFEDVGVEFTLDYEKHELDVVSTLDNNKSHTSSKAHCIVACPAFAWYPMGFPGLTLSLGAKFSIKIAESVTQYDKDDKEITADKDAKKTDFFNTFNVGPKFAVVYQIIDVGVLFGFNISGGLLNYLNNSEKNDADKAKEEAAMRTISGSVFVGYDIAELFR